MTGITEAGLEILKVIKSNTNLSVSELIELTDSVFQPNVTMLTIMLAGENEEGEFFIWQKNHEGEIMKADISAETIAFSISTNDNIELIRKHITQQLQAGAPAELAISESINFASRIDDNISPTYTIIKQLKVK